MAVKIQGLEDNARKTAIDELNARLSDGLAMSAALKQAHWNMRGRNFIGVHELLDQIKVRMDDHIDVMAERIQVMDGTAIGTVEKVAKTSTIEPYPTDLKDVDDHIKALCERMRDLGEKVRTAIDTTDEAGEANVADIFTAMSRDVDKDLWFLESNLG